MTKRQRLSELAQIIDKFCDGDKSAKDGYLLRERVTIETATGAAEALQPKRRGRKVVQR